MAIFFKVIIISGEFSAFFPKYFTMCLAEQEQQSGFHIRN
jgi:hypothetical protein